MTYSVKHARSGLTAIAAVLALSSTPLIAQEVADPLAPAAETTSTPAPEAAPEPEATTTEPVADAPADPPAAEKAAPATTTRQPATRSHTTTTTTRRATNETASTATPATAAPVTDATAEGLPVPPPPVGATVDPGAMPVDETAAAETSAMPSDETLSIVGAAGLGLFALGGIGMTIGRRRKRKEEEAHMVANRAYLDSHPAADTPAPHIPAHVRTAAPAMAVTGPGPVRTDVPRTKLPEGFDLSRFGPHVRAAYLGPTEDNPSLSMKHRLRHAAALDQQARVHGEAPREAVKAAARPDRARKPVWNTQDGGFMIRRADYKQPPKPAFQH